ncbi:hypothetical protein F5B21DRAFT_491269 [Xylaria acuta]|nr:hypothetical protein F5B21DRAFT_491269 [Xylaria acuta]
MFGAAAAASNSGKDLDASRDIELRDIHDLRLRHLTKDVYKIVSKNKPNITIRACRDALTSGTGWHVAKAVDSLIGFSNDDTGNSSLSKGSIPSKPAAESSSQSLFVALPDDHQQDSYNDSDVPWEVVHSFLTIQRVDFDSGRDFLRACEKLRQKVLITWNLRFTQIFTHTLFINAMRSYNPFLANVLRRTQLAGELEFQDLKRIIRKREMTDDTIIGSKTWAEWKAELLSTSGAYKGKEPEIY